MLNRWTLAALLVALSCQAVFAAPVRKLDPHAAYKLLNENPEIYLLDVRTLGEYQQVRLEDAHLIPIGQFVAREGQIPKDRPILVYCAVGQRSSQVAAYLARKGFPEVYDLKGGIWAWQLRKLPVLQGLP